jgi:hypothetical protein
MSASLELGKGRRVVALIGFATTPFAFGGDSNLFLSDAGLILGHSEFAVERLADPLQARSISAYRVDLGEHFVGQEEQYRGHDQSP